MINKIKSKWYSFEESIQKVITWLPIIWKDRDWDQDYLFKILHKKLELMEKHHKEYGHFVRSDKTVAQLRLAKLLTKRIISHDYFENATNPVDKKYGEVRVTFEKDEGSDFGRIIFHEAPEESKARRLAYEHSEYMEKQDIECLFDHMKKHISRWWD